MCTQCKGNVKVTTDSLLGRVQNQTPNFGSAVLLRYWELGDVVGTKMTAVSSTFALFSSFLVLNQFCTVFFGKTNELCVENRTFSLWVFGW